jgi:hypothetical protein
MRYSIRFLSPSLLYDYCTVPRLTRVRLRHKGIHTIVDAGTTMGGPILREICGVFYSELLAPSYTSLTC